MKKISMNFVICPKCGQRLDTPGNFCPNCAAPILRDVREEEERAKNPPPESERPAPSDEYYTFYGAVPPREEPEPDHVRRLGPVGTLRLLAAGAVLAGLVLGLIAGGFRAYFVWGKAVWWWVGGLAVGALLTAASFAVQLGRRGKDDDGA